MRINVVPDEIRVLGEIALVRGTIQITSAASEQRELRYLEVLTKDPSGKWKSLWGMDGPIQEYKPEAS
jgi:ketosteroid isomerase-like protein